MGRFAFLGELVVVLPGVLVAIFAGKLRWNLVSSFHFLLEIDHTRCHFGNISNLFMHVIAAFHRLQLPVHRQIDQLSAGHLRCRVVELLDVRGN